MDIKRTLYPDEQTLASHVYENIRRGVSQVVPHLEQETPVVLCCGGESLGDHIDDIRRLQLTGHWVTCVGNTGNFLAKEGIRVNGHILLDGGERNCSFVLPDRNVRYLVASQCHPRVFDAVKDHENVYIWHAISSLLEPPILNEFYGVNQWFRVDGGAYSMLRAIPLLRILGFKRIYIYGWDGCVGKEGRHHAYAQPQTDENKLHKVRLNNNVYYCHAWMIDQANQFVDCVKENKFFDVQLALMSPGLMKEIVDGGLSNSIPILQQVS